jgi:hypothetical protein
LDLSLMVVILIYKFDVDQYYHIAGCAELF